MGKEKIKEKRRMPVQNDDNSPITPGKGVQNDVQLQCNGVTKDVRKYLKLLSTKMRFVRDELYCNSQ